MTNPPPQVNRELKGLLEDVRVSKIRKIQRGSAFKPCRGQERTTSVNRLIKSYVKRLSDLDASMPAWRPRSAPKAQRTGDVAEVAGEKTGTVYDGRCLALRVGQWAATLLPGACRTTTATTTVHAGQCGSSPGVW